MKTQQSEAETSVEKRSKYERFSMTVCANGVVNICNQSHNDDTNHTYSVDLAEESCTCPAAKYHEGPCKHLTAVESKPLVVSAAEAASDSYSGPVATDGGQAEELPEITHHREAKVHSGQQYARCEGCGSESVEDSDGDTSILHGDDCPRRDDSRGTDNSRGVVDAYADRVEQRKQVDETPL